MRHSQIAAFLLLAFSLSSSARSAGVPVDLRAPDGVPLKATYFSPGKPGPAILLLHMCNSDRSAWSSLAAKLVERGFHVLAPDYRGFGESGGERFPSFEEIPPAIFEKFPGDVDTAFDYLVSRPGVSGGVVGAAGGSCSVNQSIQLARRRSEIRALVLLAGGTGSDGQAFLEQNPWLPVLASAAHDDGNLVTVTRWIWGFSANPANRFLEFDKGGHGTELFAVQPTLEPAIVDFFEQHLVRSPPTPRALDPNEKKGPSAVLVGSYRDPGHGAKMRAALRSANARGEKLDLPPEGVVNLIGYTLLGEGRIKDAVEVLLLNTEAHPTSANTYDSAADALLADGQPELAASYAEKALAALPGDPNQDPAHQGRVRGAAQAKLDQLRGGKSE